MGTACLIFVNDYLNPLPPCNVLFLPFLAYLICEPGPTPSWPSYLYQATNRNKATVTLSSPNPLLLPGLTLTEEIHLADL